MNDLTTLDFHGDELLLVDVDGKPHIILKPAIESLGLDYWAQVRKLRDRSWATTASRAVVAGDGKTREMLTCDVRTFVMLLATIDEKRVAKDVAPKLIAYQAEVADAIEAYWTKGGVINPRANEGDLKLLRQQAAVLSALTGIVDAGYLQAKGRILAARALGETPQLDPTTKPLTVSVFLTGSGLNRSQIKAVQGSFGKRIKQAYRDVYGCEPPSIEDVEGRHTITVAQYQEQHRPMFEDVWRQYFSGVAS
jgi:hypothetical protein